MANVELNLKQRTATQREDGRWVSMVRIAPGPKGRISCTCPTREGAIQKAERVAEAHRQESAPKCSLDHPNYELGSFAKFVYDVWVPHVYPGLRATSKAKYDGILVLHLLPSLAHSAIAEIGYREAETLKASLRKHDNRGGMVSDRQVAEVIYRFREIMGLYRSLESAQGRYVRDDWKLARPPRKPKKKQRTTPGDDFTLRLLEVARPYEKGAVFGLSILGLRRGEFCGLLKSKIDRQAMRMTINEQRNPLYGDDLVGTKGDERIIPLTPGLLKRLDELSDPNCLYVFTDQKGRPWKPNELSKRVPALCIRAGVQRSTPHDLRSYAASNLALCGVDPLTIMEILGHRNFDTTLIYLNGRDEEKRHALDGLLTSKWSA